MEEVVSDRLHAYFGVSTRSEKREEDEMGKGQVVIGKVAMSLLS